MPVLLYKTVFLYLVIVLTFSISYNMRVAGFEQIYNDRRDIIWTLLLTIILALWLGMRPIAPIFGDTVNYAHEYMDFKLGYTSRLEVDNEWIWVKLMYSCSQVMDVTGFFTLIALGYFGSTLWACQKLMPNGTLVAMLFMMGAFSFYAYCVNGVRNGFACSIVLLALSFVAGERRKIVIAGLLSFIAINIHRSTVLPILMMFVSMTCVKSFRYAYVFWLLSIVISLVAGNTIANFFTGLGFDDRLSYLTAEHEEGLFSKSGFRWDFLLYSMMPIVLGYYIVIMRGLRDKVYELLLNTYTLSNAFWVMVIRAEYSNRFAYLSWFMYPLVLAYPLLRMNIWEEKQGLYFSRIMLVHVGFTWFMEIIYW